MMTCPPPLAALCACMCAMSMCIHVHCVYVHACATMDALLSTPFAAPLVAPLAAPLTAPIANQSRARPRSVASSSEIGRELVRDQSRARPRSVCQEGESPDAATRERVWMQQRGREQSQSRGQQPVPSRGEAVGGWAGGEGANAKGGMPYRQKSTARASMQERPWRRVRVRVGVGASGATRATHIPLSQRLLRPSGPEQACQASRVVCLAVSDLDGAHGR